MTHGGASFVAPADVGSVGAGDHLAAPSGVALIEYLQKVGFHDARDSTRSTTYVAFPVQITRDFGGIHWPFCASPLTMTSAPQAGSSAARYQRSGDSFDDGQEMEANAQRGWLRPTCHSHARCIWVTPHIWPRGQLRSRYRVLPPGAVGMT